MYPVPVPLILFLFFITPEIVANDVEVDELIFTSSSSEGINGGDHRQRHQRRRRAPAVWGEPAPDYSAANLDTASNIYLYTLLFVDLKTSDHYRREHTVVRREVMRLASEANSYFFQINVRLLVVDILETFRADLSLYSFEQYRNQRLAQLPYHNFAVLISYRYAGGLAFVGGMCSGRNVMMAGFYPHNPEAMGSIFFHEVAHLVGVPHRPANESFAMPNCACPRGAHTASAGEGERAAGERAIGAKPIQQPADPGVSSASVIVGEPNNNGTPAGGCLRIPGFDHDCSLQWMVNLFHQRNRCLARETNGTVPSLALCGNGVVEEGEECDCGPTQGKCGEWNCEAAKCARKWPLGIMWLLALAIPAILLSPPVLWLFLRRHNKKPKIKMAEKSDRRKMADRMITRWKWKKAPEIKVPRATSSLSNFHIGRHLHPKKLFRMSAASAGQAASTKLLDAIAAGVPPPRHRMRHIPWPNNNSSLRNIWQKLRAEVVRWASGIWRRRRKSGGGGKEAEQGTGTRQLMEVRRPTRPPPPPPPREMLMRTRNNSPCCHSLSSTSTMTIRPKVAPPPAPKCQIIRPTRMAPAPPPKRRREEDEQRMKLKDVDEWKMEGEDEEIRRKMMMKEEEIQRMKGEEDADEEDDDGEDEDE